MRKITAILPAALIDSPSAYRTGLTETLRNALHDYNHHLASQRLLDARQSGIRPRLAQASRKRRGMIAVDACVVIYFLGARSSVRGRAFAALLANDEAVLPPSIVAELLSDPKGGADRGLDARPQVLPLEDGLLAPGRTSTGEGSAERSQSGAGRRLAAQACLDADVPWLTSDGDFRAFAEIARLKLAA